MLKRILVPLDGTRFGDHALPYAVDLAHRAGAVLELVHVHQHADPDPHLATMPQFQFQHISDAHEGYDAAAAAAERQSLAEKAAAIEIGHNIEVRTRLLTGRTDDAILNEARDIVADLIVLSSHGRQGLSRLRKGNVAQMLVEHLNVPALCVRPAGDAAPMPLANLRRVVIPLDGSTHSEQIMDAVLPLLQVLRARPTLLHVVWPRPLLSAGFDPEHRTIVNRQQALDYLREVAHRYRGRMQDPILTAFEDSQPANLIDSLLQLGEYDMVAMATHGRSGLSRLLLGSVAAEVLEHSNRPVLLYRPRVAVEQTGAGAGTFT
jgi:nucleotide-binding universal stress UspA family protein